MFSALGDQRAMSVFAALATVCTPIPILFLVCPLPEVVAEAAYPAA